MTMQNNLLTIDEIIARSKKSGTSLGHGDPKIHLAYLTKIRLLPQAIRRKIGDKIVGCYPDFVPSLLNKIEGLRASGLTYSQIRFQLGNGPVTPTTPKIDNFAFVRNYSNGLAFLLIGLILGFLLANQNNGGNLTVSQPATAAELPAETDSQSVMRLVDKSNSPSDPIYLIAIPQQNLYKLGSTDINLLKQ